jgi:hypothetical protein
MAITQNWQLTLSSSFVVIDAHPRCCQRSETTALQSVPKKKNSTSFQVSSVNKGLSLDDMAECSSLQILINAVLGNYSIGLWRTMTLDILAIFF